MPRLILLFSFVFIFASLSPAQEAKSPPQLFQEATNAYLAKDYKKAQSTYNEILSLEPQNAIVLTNLALTEFQLGQKYLALGLLRKALYHAPGLEVARSGLQFVSSQTPALHQSADFSFFEGLRKADLISVPLSTYFILSALCLFAAGWILISYVERRKRAFETESAPPSLPWVGALIAAFFIVFTVLFALKSYDHSLIRGTIIIEQTPLQTAPGDNQVSILDLIGGQEVQVVAQTQDWAQVLAPGKPAGWVKKSALLMTR